jgi:hypothetical protein
MQVEISNHTHRKVHNEGNVMRADIYIGIDPDTHLNGIGRLDMAGRKATATNLPFALTIDYVRDVIKAAHREGQKVAVIVECSWGEAHNWHLKISDSKAVAAKKGYAVGAMHETGKKLVEMLENYGIEVSLQRPLVKCWAGADRKITHAEITDVCGWDKKRSNQEERDAMLLAWYASGLPIKVRTNNKTK